MDIDFNGETITVDIPENFIATDAVLIVRAQNMETAGSEYLAVGCTPSTSGIMQHGMLSMVSNPESYALMDVDYDEDDE